MALETLETILYLPDDTPFFASGGDDRHWLRVFWRAVGLLALPFLLFLPVYCWGGFVWQDDIHITQNVQLWSWGGLVHVWTQFLTASYQPLAQNFLWVEHHFFGVSPLGYHLVSVALHGIDGVLLWMVLRRLHVRGAWLGAALFLAHPVQLQAVAWATQQSHLIAAAFTLGAVWAFLRLVHIYPPLPEEMVPGAGHDVHDLLPPEPVELLYVLALILSVLAVLSDPLGICIPFVLLVLIWWKRGTVLRSEWAQLLPFLVVAAAGAAVAVAARLSSPDPAGSGPVLSLVQRVLVASRAAGEYGSHLLWPYPLMFVYPRWSASLGNGLNLLFPAGWLGAGAFAWAGRKRWGRAPLAAVLLFLALLLPALLLLLASSSPAIYVADHLQYLAAAVPLAILAAGVVALLSYFSGAVVIRTLRCASAVVLLAGFGLLSWIAAQTYSGEETAWRTTLAQDENTVVARIQYANLLLRQRKVNGAAELLREAPSEEDASLLRTRARVYALQGRYSEAIRSYLAAQRLEPADRELMLGLAEAYTRDGRVGEALATYSEALRRDPNDQDVHNSMGLLELGMGPDHLPEAIEHFKAAVRRDPTYVPAKINLANALFAAGAPTEAAQQLREAAELEPRNFVTYVVDAQMSYRLHDYANAERMCQVAVQLRPDSAEAWNNLGVAQFAQHRASEAAWSFDRALRIKPDYVEARQNLEVARERVASGEK